MATPPLLDYNTFDIAHDLLYHKLLYYTYVYFCTFTEFLFWQYLISDATLLSVVSCYVLRLTKQVVVGLSLILEGEATI